MWIKSLNLTNIHSFVNEPISFSKGINILVGPNNSGKSTILLPLLSLQDGLPSLSRSNLRVETTEGSAQIHLADSSHYFSNDEPEYVQITCQQNKPFLLQSVSKGKTKSWTKFPPREPGNFIYPFLAKRKTVKLNEQMNISTANSVGITLENLNARIDALITSDGRDMFLKVCDNILGFQVMTKATSQGKSAGYFVRNSRIGLLSMGEGTIAILGLAVYLAVAERQLFIIEEVENDVHPKALKALLELIGKKAQNNQFIITTHSNIVLKLLGALPDAKVFRVDCKFENGIPTSSITEAQSAEERREILLELGYDFADFGLHDAWLILEEASAERIIEELLIPWFAESLRTKLRTCSTRGRQNVEQRFEDLNRLFVCVRLQEMYTNRAWVLIDGGEDEKKIIDRLKETYKKSGWREEQFRQFKQHDFESYYPQRFRNDVDDINKIVDPKENDKKRGMKTNLLNNVVEWARTNEDEAKRAFESSAAEVIEILREIERDLKASHSNHTASQ